MRDPDYNILAKLRPQTSKKTPRTSIAGCVFGQLMAFALVGYLKAAQGTGCWLCRCSCGNWSIVNRNKLQRGLTKTCGCQSTVRKTHGMRRTPVYQRWIGMLTRVRNPRTKSQHNYIGRGIRACSGLQKFETFYALIGNPKPKEQLDRIDNNGHYSCGRCQECIDNHWPMNIRWATSKINNRNRRNTRWVTINGETKRLIEWAEITGVLSDTAAYRLKHNWTPEQAFEFKEPPSRKKAVCKLISETSYNLRCDSG